MWASTTLELVHAGAVQLVRKFIHHYYWLLHKRYDLTVAISWINLCHVTYSKIFIDQNLGNWKAFHVTKGTVIDPSYSLPPNVALITLEVDLIVTQLAIAHLTLSFFLSNFGSFTGVGLWNGSSPFGTFI